MFRLNIFWWSGNLGCRGVLKWKIHQLKNHDFRGYWPPAPERVDISHWNLAWMLYPHRAICKPNFVGIALILPELHAISQGPQKSAFFQKSRFSRPRCAINKFFQAKRTAPSSSASKVTPNMWESASFFSQLIRAFCWTGWIVPGSHS